MNTTAILARTSTCLCLLMYISKSLCLYQAINDSFEKWIIFMQIYNNSYFFVMNGFLHKSLLFYVRRGKPYWGLKCAKYRFINIDSGSQSL